MADYTCEYCGTGLSSSMLFCPGCGAPNPHCDPAAVSAPSEPTPPEEPKPRTINALRAFCARKNMPLDKMRFFIGVDERSPRAFGIYREGSDFIVYKNKSDGTRVIRYRGPDEARAVNEIYQKLLDEHRQRMGGGPVTREPARGSAQYNVQYRKKSWLKYFPIILILLAYLAFVFQSGKDNFQNGYYRVGEELFYRYGSSWYLDTGDIYDGWTEIDDFPYDDAASYYQGSTYDTGWGGSDFADSWYWSVIQDDSGYDYDYDYDYDDSDWDSDWDDYDYDDWDSDDTDWDSDW